MGFISLKDVNFFDFPSQFPQLLAHCGLSFLPGEEIECFARPLLIYCII